MKRKVMKMIALQSKEEGARKMYVILWPHVFANAKLSKEFCNSWKIA